MDLLDCILVFLVMEVPELLCSVRLGVSVCLGIDAWETFFKEFFFMFEIFVFKRSIIRIGINTMYHFLPLDLER